MAALLVVVGVAVLAVLSQCANAFSNTYPIVAWSSHDFNSLSHLPKSLSSSAHAASVLEILSHGDGLCEHDAIVVIDQPGLHASDLRTLPSTSALIRTLTSAPSSRQFPYVRSPSRVPLSSIAQSLSERCGARLVDFVLEDHPVSLDSTRKHIIRIILPPLDGLASSRRSSFAGHVSRLFAELDAISSSFPRNLVIFAGSPLHYKRQSIDDALQPMLRNVFDVSDSSKSSKTGILARYQLLTPGLIISLLVTFFILVPVILVGVSALASIQPPLRMETPKGYSALEKKNQ